MQEPPIPGNKKHDNGPHGLLMFTVNLPWASRKDAYWPIDTYKSCICLTSGYTHISCFETFIARPWTAITWASLWWFRSSFAIEWLQHGPIRDLKRPWPNHSIPYRTIVTSDKPGAISDLPPVPWLSGARAVWHCRARCSPIAPDPHRLPWLSAKVGG
jgi:hypothetical protein